MPKSSDNELWPVGDKLRLKNIYYSEKWGGRGIIEFSKIDLNKIPFRVQLTYSTFPLL